MQSRDQGTRAIEGPAPRVHGLGSRAVDAVMRRGGLRCTWSAARVGEQNGWTWWLVKTTPPLARKSRFGVLVMALFGFWIPMLRGEEEKRRRGESHNGR